MTSALHDPRVHHHLPRRRRRLALGGLAVALAGLLVVAVPAGASPLPPPPNDPALPANCPAVRNPPGNPAGYGLPANAYINGGVLTDGSTVASNLTASTCGLFVLPIYPPMPDPVPGAPAINPAVPENAAVIPPAQTRFTQSGSLALNATPGLGAGSIALFPAGNTTAVVRQIARPNGGIDLDITAPLLSVVSIAPGGGSTLAECWIGGKTDSGATYTPPPGYTIPPGAPSTPGVDPASAFLSTANDPSLTPPAGGAKPPAPVTGPLGDATAVVVAQPFTLTAGNCNASAGLPIIGSLLGSTLTAILNATLTPNGARFSAPFTLSLSLT